MSICHYPEMGLHMDVFNAISKTEIMDGGGRFLLYNEQPMVIHRNCYALGICRKLSFTRTGIFIFQIRTKTGWFGMRRSGMSTHGPLFQ